MLRGLLDAAVATAPSARRAAARGGGAVPGRPRGGHRERAAGHAGDNLAFFGISGEAPVTYDELFQSAGSLYKKLNRTQRGAGRRGHPRPGRPQVRLRSARALKRTAKRHTVAKPNYIKAAFLVPANLMALGTAALSSAATQDVAARAHRAGRGGPLPGRALRLQALPARGARRPRRWTTRRTSSRSRACRRISPPPSASTTRRWWALKQKILDNYRKLPGGPRARGLQRAAPGRAAAVLPQAAGHAQPVPHLPERHGPQAGGDRGRGAAARSCRERRTRGCRR